MKIYFKNLDGIRFIAAFLVLLHHAFFFKKHFSPGYDFINNALTDAGRMGVNLFFVLSGFLISYLLLIEKDNTGTVSYRNFYLRRILRIWPLYLSYGLVLAFIGPLVLQQLGLEHSPGIGTTLLNLLFLFFFAVNIQLAFVGGNAGVFEISWSVCIEEQFYLIWPLIMNKLRKHLVKVFVAMFLLRSILRVLCVILPQYTDLTRNQLVDINYLLIFDKLDLFGGGMMFALLYYNKDKYGAFLKKILHPAIQFAMLLIALLYTLAIIRPPKDIFFFGDHTISIVLFGYLILAAISENSILNLEAPLLKTLGKISFGIYLFHTAICQLSFILFSRIIKNPGSHFIYDLIYPLFCLVITCGISYLSYEYFEKIFLKKKMKFAIVKTRL